MWSNISQNVNQSLQSVAKRLTDDTSPDDDDDDDRPETQTQVERLRADRDHFRALATQAEVKRLELESSLRAEKNRVSELESERKPADGQDRSQQFLESELKRFRDRLVAVEEEYTQDLLAAERREELLRRRVQELEEELRLSKDSDQQIRTLRTERDVARNEVSSLEDRLQTYSASVANLQVVIEQIQRENERKVTAVELKLERQLELEREKARTTLNQLEEHSRRLRSTAEALGAASRLSESLDAKECVLAGVRAEALRKDALIGQQRDEMKALRQEMELKVDKQVVKALVFGYFVADDDRKPEVQRLIARILDFNAQEMQKSGIPLKKTTQDSLSLKFVEFLENESKPTKVDREVVKDLSRSLLSSERANPFVATSRQTLESSGNQLLWETPVSAVLVSTPEKLEPKSNSL